MSAPSLHSKLPPSSAYRWTRCTASVKFVEENAPLRRNVTIEDVGNVAAFLLSDLAAAVTGEITYVDCGFRNVMGGMDLGAAE